MANFFDFPLTDRTKLCVGFDEYKGKEFFNVRQFALNASGEWVATPKGVSIPDVDPEKLGELSEFFKSAFAGLSQSGKDKKQNVLFFARAKAPSGDTLKTKAYRDFDALVRDLDVLGWRAFFQSEKVRREEYEEFGFSSQRELNAKAPSQLFMREVRGTASKTKRIVKDSSKKGWRFNSSN